LAPVWRFEEEPGAVRFVTVRDDVDDWKVRTLPGENEAVTIGLRPGSKMCAAP
jgi:hypothetical protein